MGVGTLLHHMATIVLLEQWHAYAKLQKYLGTKQIILLKQQMPPGFLIVMSMNNLLWRGLVTLALKV